MNLKTTAPPVRAEDGTPAPGPATPAAATAAPQWQLLHSRFLAGLAQRADDLQAAAAQPTPAHPQLHQLLHRLVGAAGAYGEDALAEQARQLMHTLQATPACNANREPINTALQQLTRRCRELALAAQQAEVAR